MTDEIKLKHPTNETEITREKVDQLCILAQLELTEEEVQKAVVDMKKTLDYFGQIENAVVEVENNPNSFSHEVSEEESGAVVANNCGVELLESNAPAWQNGMLVVPKTF